MAEPLLAPQTLDDPFGPSGDLDEREPFAAFVTDEDSHDVLQTVISTQAWLGAAVETGGLADAVRTYGVLPPPRRLVVDLCESDNPIADFRMLQDAVGADTIVVTVGTQNDVTLYRALIEAGAADYLVKPLSADALLGALTRSDQPTVAAEATPSQAGRLTLVIGARGGIGASAVALNAAWGMAHRHDLKVALVDLDLQFGTQALALDLEPGHGLREALEAPDRVDELFIDRAMVAASDNLFVFSAEEALDTAPNYETHSLLGLLDDLRGRFDRVVVDLPRLVVGARRELLGAAEDIVIVSDLSLVALRDTLRLKRLLHEVGANARLSVVANRVGAKSATQISLKEFEKGFDAKLDYTVAYDEKLAQKAANVGEPMVKLAKRGRAVDPLLKLGERLALGADAPESNANRRAKAKQSKAKGKSRAKPKKKLI